jgi:hypothetical protein
MKTELMPVTLTADNLSLGWGLVLDALAKPGVTRLAPLTLTITGFDEAGWKRRGSGTPRTWPGRSSRSRTG